MIFVSDCQHFSRNLTIELPLYPGCERILKDRKVRKSSRRQTRISKWEMSFNLTFITINRILFSNHDKDSLEFSESSMLKTFKIANFDLLTSLLVVHNPGQVMHCTRIIRNILFFRDLFDVELAAGHFSVLYKQLAFKYLIKPGTIWRSFLNQLLVL